jgi:hypothetical protein
MILRVHELNTKLNFEYQKHNTVYNDSTLV